MDSEALEFFDFGLVVFVLESVLVFILKSWGSKPCKYWTPANAKRHALLWLNSRPYAGSDVARQGDKPHTILETIELSDAPPSHYVPAAQKLHTCV